MVPPAMEGVTDGVLIPHLDMVPVVVEHVSIVERNQEVLAHPALSVFGFT